MTNNTIYYHNFGLIDYKVCWEKQKDFFLHAIETKVALGKTENHLILCEHLHVYTLGKSGNNNNLLIKEEELKEIQASFYHVDRGGDITYHGPGQIVGYLIFDLDSFALTIKKFVHSIEESIIHMLHRYTIYAGRKEKATGVWLSGLPERKICAIGIKASRNISMHGFALNVNTDLSFFTKINPCGFTDKYVTSMQKELDKTEIPMEEAREILLQSISVVFNAKLIPV